MISRGPGETVPVLAGLLGGKDGGEGFGEGAVEDGEPEGGCYGGGGGGECSEGHGGFEWWVRVLGSMELVGGRW